MRNADQTWMIAVLILIGGCASTEKKLVGKWAGYLQMECPESFGKTDSILAIPMQTEVEFSQEGRMLWKGLTEVPGTGQYWIEEDTLYAGHGPNDWLRIDFFSEESLVLRTSDEDGCDVKITLSRK